MVVLTLLLTYCTVPRELVRIKGLDSAHVLPCWRKTVEQTARYREAH